MFLFSFLLSLIMSAFPMHTPPQIHALDSVGGGMTTVTTSADSVGGGMTTVTTSADSVGGGMTAADSVGGGM